jgi:hypothetical protein
MLCAKSFSKCTIPRHQMHGAYRFSGTREHKPETILFIIVSVVGIVVLRRSPRCMGASPFTVHVVMVHAISHHDVLGTLGGKNMHIQHTPQCVLEKRPQELRNEIHL